MHFTAGNTLSKALCKVSAAQLIFLWVHVIQVEFMILPGEEERIAMMVRPHHSVATASVWCERLYTNKTNLMD